MLVPSLSDNGRGRLHVRTLGKRARKRPLMFAEEFELFRAEPDARTFFRNMQRKRASAEYWRCVVIDGVDALTRTGERVGHAGISDPTGAQAVLRVSTDAQIRERAQTKLDECELYLSAGLIVVEAVRAGLGETYADALDLHYMEGLSERDAAEDMNVSRSTLARWLAIACEWCDWQGKRLFM